MCWVGSDLLGVEKRAEVEMTSKGKPTSVPPMAKHWEFWPENSQHFQAGCKRHTDQLKRDKASPFYNWKVELRREFES